MKRVFSVKVIPPGASHMKETVENSHSRECTEEDSSFAGDSSATNIHECKENAPPATVLGIAAEDCGITTISLSMLQGMWKKAENLVQCKCNVLKLPWCFDVKSRLLKSSSSDHPHVVKPNPRNLQQYLCDDKCPMYKAFFLCSHVIAVAHDNGDLHSFLQYYTYSKCVPNLTAILPTKGCPMALVRRVELQNKRNHKSTPIETRSVCPCLQTSTENNSKLDTSDSSFLLGSSSHSQTTLAHSSHNVTCDSHQSPYVAPNPEHASLQNSASLSASIGPKQGQSPCCLRSPVDDSTTLSMFLQFCWS